MTPPDRPPMCLLAALAAVCLLWTGVDLRSCDFFDLFLEFGELALQFGIEGHLAFSQVHIT